jgi:citrate synthase
MALYLTAREAAAELDVSLATLYAYVSRGLVRSEPVQGSRARRYRAEDIRAMRERRAPPGGADAGGMFGWNRPVLESSITLIAEGELFYRGVNVLDLARHATLETAAGVLWQTADYDPFLDTNLPPEVPELDRLKTASQPVHPIDRCISALTLAGGTDLGACNRTDRGLALAAARITRLLTAVIGNQPASSRPVHEQLADAWELNRAGTELVRMALVLLADHELNASTFTLRCAVSTGATIYDGTIAALAAFKGPLHGGATTRAHRQLETLIDGDPDALIREQAEAGELFAGFGHRISRETDPRARFLLDAIERELDEEFLTTQLPARVHEVAGVRPTVDYALAALTHLLGLPKFAGIGLFAVGRSIGWAAHAREQMREHTLIRPRALYAGPAPKTG